MKVIRHARYRARNMRLPSVPLFTYTIPINRGAVKALNEWVTAIARTPIRLPIPDEPIVPTRAERRRIEKDARMSKRFCFRYAR